MTTATISAATPNSLIRGELAAVETYQQALTTFEDSTVRAALQEIRAHHEASATQLRGFVREQYEEPADTSGMWGYWASLVTGAAKLLGDQTALAALRTGEQHGQSVYEKALNDDSVADEIKTAIRKTLLPRCEAHLRTLDGLSNTINKK